MLGIGLNFDLHRKNIINDPHCSCGAIETSNHYLTECLNYTLQRGRYLSNLPCPLCPSHIGRYDNLRQDKTDLRSSVTRNRKKVVRQVLGFMVIARPIFVVGRSLVMFKILPATEMVVADNGILQLCN